MRTNLGWQDPSTQDLKPRGKHVFSPALFLSWSENLTNLCDLETVNKHVQVMRR